MTAMIPRVTNPWKLKTVAFNGLFDPRMLKGRKAPMAR